MNTDVFKMAWPTCNDYILTVGGEGKEETNHEGRSRAGPLGKRLLGLAAAAAEGAVARSRRGHGRLLELETLLENKTKQNNKVSFLLSAWVGTVLEKSVATQELCC